MATCPHCKYEFWPIEKKNSFNPEQGDILVHECVSGFFRPYRAEWCRDCKTEKFPSETLIWNRVSMEKENRSRKHRLLMESIAAQREEKREARTMVSTTEPVA
jgi:hypothetical protein